MCVVLNPAAGSVDAESLVARLDGDPAVDVRRVVDSHAIAELARSVAEEGYEVVACIGPRRARLWPFFRSARATTSRATSVSRVTR